MGALDGGDEVGDDALAFSLAEMVHGNGFIAAFCAGLALGTRTPEVRHRIQ